MLGKKLRKSGSMLSPFPQKPKTLNNTEQNCGKCTITIPTINEKCCNGQIQNDHISACVRN